MLFAIGLAEAAGAPKDCPCGAKSESSSEKLVNYSEIISGFEKGDDKVKVIVNLVEAPGIRANMRWESKDSLRALHSRIKDIQLPVLNTLGNDEFKLRHRFENQAGFSGEVTLEALEKLVDDPRVASIEPVYLLKEHLAQGIPLMNASVYRSSYNGQGVAVAICDTGVDYYHPRLGGASFPNTKVIGGYDTADGDSNPYPSHPHGTACAGIAAGDLGTTGDYIGGVAYGAKIYALKAMDNSGYIYNDYIIAAWNWCVTHKNDNPSYPIVVISTSLGGYRYFSTCDGSESALATAANNAVAAGITLTVSSGNDGYCDSLASPACLSNVISVGAVYDSSLGTSYPCVSAQSCVAKTASGGCSTGYYATDDTYADRVTSYSNTASFLTLLAPSDDCYTTDITGSGGYSSGDYMTDFAGTSAACPYAAGAVACLQSAAKSAPAVFLHPRK